MRSKQVPFSSSFVLEVLRWTCHHRKHGHLGLPGKVKSKGSWWAPRSDFNICWWFFVWLGLHHCEGSLRSMPCLLFRQADMDRCSSVYFLAMEACHSGKIAEFVFSWVCYSSEQCSMYIFAVLFFQHFVAFITYMSIVLHLIKVQFSSPSDKSHFLALLFHLSFTYRCPIIPCLNQDNMPGVTFTDAQVEILSGDIEEYQKITGKDRATEKTNFISELAKKVASSDELKDSKAVDNIEVVSISRIILPVKTLKISTVNQKLAIDSWLGSEEQERVLQKY